MEIGGCVQSKIQSASSRVTTAVLAAASPGQPPNPAKRTHAAREGGEGPALGRAGSGRTLAPVSPGAERQSYVTRSVCGTRLGFAKAKPGQPSPHTARYFHSVSTKSRSSALACAVGALSSGASCSGTCRRQVMPRYRLLKKKKKKEINGMGRLLATADF